MNKVMQVPKEENAVAGQHFSSKQIEILKNTICNGASNEEFEVFLMACTKTQLDPFMRQIYAVKRKCKKPDGTWGEVMSIQTGIDGYRLIAERTGCYAPGPEPTYTYDAEGRILSASAYIKKQTRDGTWHTVSASAYIDEYCQRTRDGNAMGMWGNMPRTMLAKCAESQALRKAFPAEMSGVYTKEEMQQADPADLIVKISFEQAEDLRNILEECDADYKKWVFNYLQKQYKTDNLSELPLDIYDRMKLAAIKNMDANHAKQLNAEPVQIEAAQ
jgi:phage recombination protein Bet